jgi:hypothetical protein
VNFFDADRLAGKDRAKDRAEVNLFVPQTDPDAMGDENSLSDQTASLLKLNKACAEARGTPLTLFRPHISSVSNNYSGSVGLLSTGRYGLDLWIVGEYRG